MGFCLDLARGGGESFERGTFEMVKELRDIEYNGRVGVNSSRVRSLLKEPAGGVGHKRRGTSCT